MLFYEYFTLPILGWVPRYVYGNNAGLVNNLRSPRHLAALQNAYAGVKPRVSEAEEFRKQGMTALGYPHPADLTQRIHTKLLACLEDPERSVAQGGPPYQKAHVLVKDPLKHIPEVEQLLSPAVIRAVEGYYGCGFRVETLRCWRNYHVPGMDTQSNVFSNQWHNDQFDTNVMKYFIYFTDGINRDNGAFRCHPIPGTKKVMRAFGFFRRSHIFGPAKKMIEDPARIAYLEGGVGFSFLANPTLCVHRAGIPAEGQYRDIVQFTFLPSAQPLAADWAAQMPADDLSYL